MIEKLSVQTDQRTQFIEITDLIQALISQRKIKQGICYIYVPHTTAGLIINEHADPDVIEDIGSMLDKMVPWRAGYAHTEGNSAAHIKASLAGTSQNLMIENGRLALGTWQGIFYAEFDGPRSREVWVTITGA
jgi:secondary thiamine-phosphate synthase enzyme